MKRFAAFFCLTLFLCSAAAAHEYYLEPTKYSVALDEQFGVEHKNGMRFKGNAYPFINAWNVRSEAWQNGAKVDLRGKDGDRPALTLKSNRPGLVILVHESKPETLKFLKWEKFVSYLADEGLEHMEAEHLKAGHPREGIKEIYTRFAKTLVNVGGTEGNDQPTGLKFELVALENPARLAKGAPLPIQALLDGKPLADATIKVFAGIDTEAAHRIKTDAEGKAMIPDDGAGPYLLNAVHMVPPVTNGGQYDDAHWETYWASLVLAR
ncbi:DUF4198 domain-containing protein [Pseudahrensia aquimaris]|uniref:DUF4198 domain-containing protein n=1 Tax=Pseudahrensia aquimaris TaxID=744461 RepID=A0ABW3FCR4_9HYPH